MLKGTQLKNSIFACIPLNLVFLFNNEWKKIKIYIDCLNDMLKSAQVKVLFFACKLLNPVFLLNNECKKINIYID